MVAWVNHPLTSSWAKPEPPMVAKVKRKGEKRICGIWRGMRQRCYNRKTGINYLNYGGRGIYICDEWKDNFEAFRDWSLANGYQDDLSIDRIDNDGPYAPWNCRWTTRAVQFKNRRGVVCVTCDGITKATYEWDKAMGFPRGTVSQRIREGWEEKIAVKAPYDPKWEKVYREVYGRWHETKEDVVGKRFGNLTVLREWGKDRKGCDKVLVACDCGREKILSKIPVVYGKQLSCGCLKHKRRKAS